MSEIILTIENIDLVALYGEGNSKLNLVRKAFPNIIITSRGNNIKLTGEKKYTQKAKAKLEAMVRMLKENMELSTHTVTDLLDGGNPYEVRLSNGPGNATIVHGRNG